MSAPLPQPATLADHTAPLCAAIEALGVERFALAGSQTGAAVALHAAAETFGDRVAHLIFSGLPYFTPEDVTYFRTNTVRPEAASDGGHLVETWARIRRRWGLGTDTATLQWALACGLLATDRPSGPTLAVFDYDMADALARVRCPIQFLNGPHDPLLPQDRLAIPLVPRRARVDIVDAPPGVSPAHATPALYAEALLRFLDGA